MNKYTLSSLREKKGAEINNDPVMGFGLSDIFVSCV